MAVAAVVGATGAIGREVVLQLLADSAFTKVITVGRREVAVDEQHKAAAEQKLVQKVVNMDELKSNTAAFEGATAVFCALGTTRKVAGSAAAFKKVDLEYVESAAAAAKAAGAQHFSLVTAQGANPRVWASDLGIFHALLYTRCKGLAEEAAKQQGFRTLSIFRPGLLDRGAQARGIERAMLNLPLVGALKVSDIARVMVLDAKRALGLDAGAAAGAGAAQPPVAVYEDGVIKRAAAANTAPPV